MIGINNTPEDNDLAFMYAVSMPHKGGHKVYLFDPISYGGGGGV